MIIYKCENKVNNKVYIGQTIKTLEYRKKRHYTECKRHDSKFYRALRKYKEDDFEWSEIDIADTIENLNKKEMYWVRYYNSFDKGYNSTLGGDGSSGLIPSNKTKEKMSNSHLGKSAGERNGNSKLKEKDVIKIIKLFAEGVAPSEITKLYSVNVGSIRDIISGRTWKSIDRNSIKNKIAYNRSVKLKENDVVDIIYMLNLKKYKYVDIAKLYGVSISTIKNISKNKSWKNIERL